MLIEEEEVKKNPKISDVDFELVGRYPPLYYSNEVKVIGRLKLFIIDIEFDDAKTIKQASNNDDSETIMYASDNEVSSDVEMWNMMT